MSKTSRYHSPLHRWARYFAQRLILRSVIFSNVRVTVEGERHVADLDGPFIVVANHSSHLDAPLCITALPYSVTKNVATAVAADYFYSSTWRSMLTSLFFNSYPVERGKSRGKSAGLSVTLLRQGVPLLIFPEGTRSRTGEMADFTPGAAALGRALRVPIVPVALVGAHDAMPPGTFWPKSGRMPVKVLIGKPVRVRPREALADLNARLTARVRAMHTMQTSYVLVTEDDRAESGETGRAENDMPDAQEGIS
ncbi:lysophospholipid acyltransferase family protein [Ruania alba]|uniref:1-acyl-sn-glycerol-3-phosphate acyltransferase n=1 Tax=Ruania alba TaxID=648782 RepID=A0A1H5LV16_9MICO|nr:lysophospholipid acyltransferase family protein [Ruania alba]SEE80834.1 1-acyl-sn-glycerol-3-phosphate acyltransferase [Ruania alba]